MAAGVLDDRGHRTLPPATLVVEVKSEVLYVDEEILHFLLRLGKTFSAAKSEI